MGVAVPGCGSLRWGGSAGRSDCLLIPRYGRLYGCDRILSKLLSLLQFLRYLPASATIRTNADSCHSFHRPNLLSPRLAR